jgi:hypothetical protein
MEILHCFADEGIESEALSAYGNVTRVGLNPTDNPHTDTLISADARDVEFERDFDLGLFHPPCQKWAAQTHVHGDRDDHENLIPVARELAQKYCTNWIIENVPGAPLRSPVALNGGMFGLPLHYEREFETSYHVDQPRNQARLCGGNETLDEHHEKGGWVGGVELWKGVKGYSGEYEARSLKREAVPRAYIDYLARPLLS